VEHSLNSVTVTVFVLLFLLVTVIGFVAGRWRQGDLDLLDEWGLAGRRFGTWVTWFLVGGDIYTAYTFIAVPALVFGSGAIGFFAVPYTIIVYPIVFIVFPRLWAVSKKHGYITPADFARGRYGSGGLALVIALTGFLATMPYIALQLVGIQTIIAAMGVQGEGIVGDLPLIIAFVILAAYTYQSGLRAPALIAVVKDTLIYLTVIVAIVYIPIRLGGFGNIFDSAAKNLPPGSVIPQDAATFSSYATLALGSALALFLYPHALTGIFSASSGHIIRRNATLLSAYSLALGFLALFGYMVIAASIKPADPNFTVPDLFLRFFPSWFVGVAFAAVAIGALVPAAIMSIAAANLFTRNVYKEYIRRDISDAEESRVARLTSLVVKAGALAFVLFVPTEFAIYLQLLGGVWIIQTLPTIMVGLYTRWFHRWALIVGWAAGMATGTTMAISQSFAPVFPLQIGGFSFTVYTALFAVLVNLIVTVVLTPVFSALGAAHGEDETSDADYMEFREVTGQEQAEPTGEPAR
jgi:solute:Na+ symporter, SSS family